VIIKDIEGIRTLEINGNNEHLPNSVFLIAGDHCIELDRATLVRAFMKEMLLWEPVHFEAERYLASVA
jgi:hypothetical protein